MYKLSASYFNPCATSASLARLPATTTRFSVSKASMLPPCHPIAFMSNGTTWNKIGRDNLIRRQKKGIAV